MVNKRRCVYLPLPCSPWTECTNPLVRGSRWCLSRGRPFCRATSMLWACFLSVKRVPSQNSSSWQRQHGIALISVSEWMSEQVLNGASAQLGYTMTFTSKYAGKYRTGDKLRIQTIYKLNATQNKKQATENTAKQNYPGSVAFYDTSQETRDGLILLSGSSKEKLVNYMV